MITMCRTKHIFEISKSSYKRTEKHDALYLNKNITYKLLLLSKNITKAILIL